MKAVEGIYRDGSIRLDEDPCIRGSVPVILTILEKAPRRRGRRQRDVGEHPAFWMWADRTDIADSVEFADDRRREGERRRDER